jgi:LacI family transcriptional regulator
MVTLKQIAEAMGVTPTTVSNILNGKNKEVRPSARRRAKKIREMAARMNYRPHAAARTVKTGRFGHIACMITEYRNEQYEPFNVSGLLPYVNVVTKFLANKGYSTIVEPVYLDIWEEVIEISPVFSEVIVDGIIGVAACGTISPEIDRRIRDMNLVVVWLNRMCESQSDVPCVWCDEIVGANLLVDHLVELGHRRIAYLGADGKHYSCRMRSKGISDAFLRHGLDTSYVIDAGWDPTAEKLAMQMLTTRPVPTAIICYNRNRYDLMLHYACRLGLRVPEDLSLCCFAGFHETGTIECPITAAVIPEGRISDMGVNFLIDRIESHRSHNEIGPVAPSLHVGATTAPAPAANH